MAPEITALREAIHRCPELGNREYETAARAEAFLRSCGFETARLTETAIAATLRGALPGPTVALRSELDALPVTEATGAAFASEREGVMHACGHDVHLAAALGAAKLLSAHRDALPGTVKLFLEPDEEGSGGAARMIDGGCMGDTEAVFGCHLDPALPLGTVGVRFGKFYAASDVFTVTVRGKSAHGAQREQGVDALAAAARMVTALLELPEELLPERSALNIGTLRAGTAENVVPALAELRGILRSLGPDSRALLRRRLRETVGTVASETGTAAEVTLRPSYGGVVNTDAETELVRRTAEELLGEDRVRLLAEPTLTTEDFGCFIDAAAGSFYHIGAGCSSPLHAADFLPNGNAAVTAAALHAAVVWEYLRNNSQGHT
ncbi:MAG: amidohydrolase [Oscillospiraceae bacterium]|nr:amidohydrolase [Oscillospiraceae bacterium]